MIDRQVESEWVKSDFLLSMVRLDELMTPAIITIEMVVDLRMLTGEGMMACNKALTQAKGDQEKAVDYLRRM